MKAKSSIHLAPGASGYLAHNSRESYSKSQVFHDEKNELRNNKKEAFEIYKSELAARSAAYTNCTKQKLQKNAVTHYSTIINLHQHHNLADLKELTDYLEKTLDTKIFQVAIHKDEGKLINKKTGLKLVSGEDFFCNPKDKKLYSDEKFTKPINMSDWTVEKNYHAHVEMMGLDSNGKAIKRNRLTRTYLKELQTFTAKSLKMERGNTVDPYTKKEMTEIKNLLKPKHTYPSNRAYGIAFNKVAKELGYYKKNTKRIDTNNFKQIAKAKNDVEKEKLAEEQKLIKKASKIIRSERAKVDAVTEESKNLRAVIATNNKLKREEWAELEAQIKALKAQAKAKELTLDGLHAEIVTLKAKYLSKDTELNKLKAEVKELTEQNTALGNTITAKDAVIVSQGDKIEELEAFKTKVTVMFEKLVNNFENLHIDTALKGFERSYLYMQAKINTLTNDLKQSGITAPVVADMAEQRVKQNIVKTVITPLKTMLKEGFDTELIANCMNAIFKNQSPPTVLVQSERNALKSLCSYQKKAFFATSLESGDVQKMIDGLGNNHLANSVYSTLYANKTKAVATDKTHGKRVKPNQPNIRTP